MVTKQFERLHQNVPPVNPLSYLLRPAESLSYDETRHLVEAIEHDPREAIRWLQRNDAITAKAFEYARRTFSSGYIVEVAFLLLRQAVIFQQPCQRVVDPVEISAAADLCESHGLVGVAEFLKSRG